MKNSTSCPQPLTKAGYLLGHLDVTRLLAALALEDSSSVLVELQAPSQSQFKTRHDTRKRNIQATNLEGSDDNVGGVDANRGSSSVALLNVDSVDVDDPLLPVDLDTKTFCQTISISLPFEFSIV